MVSRLNNEERGKSLGSFKGDDKILTIYKSGHYLISGFELSNKFDDDLIHIEKWHPSRPVASVYWNPSKELYFVKRFLIEVTTKKYLFIDESCELVIATVDYQPKVKISFNKRLKETKDLNDKIVDINNIVDVKGDKAKGNQLTRLKVKEITLMDVMEDDNWPAEKEPVLITADEATDSVESNDTIEDEKVINQTVDTISNEESEVLNVDTNSEGPVELEWDADIDNDKAADEDGQMKIF